MNVGEVIASRTFSGSYDVADQAAHFVQTWLDNPPHRAIILGEQIHVTQIGVGCAHGKTPNGQTTIYCVGDTGIP